MKTLFTIGYLPVRISEGREWLNVSDISLDRDDCARKARARDHGFPDWARQNPMTRIAKVRIEEIPE